MDPTQRGTPSTAANRADPADASPHAERVDPAAPAAASTQAGLATLPATPASAPARRCANCDELAPGKFCAACGQETRDPRVTFRALFTDFLDDYLSLDSRLFRSLVPLLFKPGRLTAEYLSGRRQRYIRPLRLYLVTSVAFFLLLSVPGLLGGGSPWQPGMRIVDDPTEAARTPAGVDAPVPVDGTAETSGLGGEAPADVSGTGTPEVTGNALPDAAGPDVPPVPEAVRAAVRSELGDDEGSFARFILKTVTMASDDPEASVRYMTQEIRRLAPQAVFAMLPIFALLLTVLYRRSGRYYVEHFVFALHLHAFVFLLLTAALFSPIPRTGRFLFLWAVVYVFLALRRVYGGSILKTGFKYVFLLGTYFVLQTAVLAGIVITLIVRA